MQSTLLFGSALASTHLEKQSEQVAMYLFPRLFSFNGPMILIPICCQTCGWMAIGCSLLRCFCSLALVLLQWSHLNFKANRQSTSIYSYVYHVIKYTQLVVSSGQPQVCEGMGRCHHIRLSGKLPEPFCFVDSYAIRPLWVPICACLTPVQNLQFSKSQQLPTQISCSLS